MTLEFTAVTLDIEADYRFDVLLYRDNRDKNTDIFFFPHHSSSALSYLLQWNYRCTLPAFWGHVCGIWPMGNQSADWHHFLLCGHHHPAADHPWLPVSVFFLFWFFWFFKARSRMCSRHIVPWWQCKIQVRIQSVWWIPCNVPLSLEFN